MSMILYTSRPDNCREVVEFIGGIAACPLCNNTGEYESEYGPKGCNECNSRLIPFIDANGNRVTADWDDYIERREDGLHLIRICHCGSAFDDHNELSGHSPVKM